MGGACVSTAVVPEIEEFVLPVNEYFDGRHLQEQVVRKFSNYNYQNFYNTFKTAVGKGCNGAVLFCSHKKYKNSCVVKKIKRTGHVGDGHINQEIRAMLYLDHPQILRLLECYRTEEEYFLISSYCRCDNLLKLLQRVRKFDEERSRKSIYDLLTVIRYCHSKNIVHGDIKLENILVEGDSDNLRLKLIGTNLQMLTFRLIIKNSSSRFQTTFF
jgi:calcium-dependent protein kinase